MNEMTAPVPSAAATESRRGAAHPPMGELAVLPVFFALAGKRVVLAGATERAVWKAELLHATGADLDVYAAAPCEAMRALAGQAPRLALHERAWTPDDLRGAALVLLDTLDDAEAGAFRDAARLAGAPMNSIDNPAFCDFQFGAIVNRSPLVIGISTHGTAPVFGQAIRGRLETLLPASLQTWAKAALAWRARVVPLHLPFHARRKFWELFSQRALGTQDRPPSEADFATFLEAAKAVGAPSSGAGHGVGRVTLVGAGPGDPDLITLKAPARAAGRRCRALRQSGRARDRRHGAPRGAKDRRRQARLSPLLQTGRDHRDDGGACPRRETRRASEGR